MIIFYNVWHKTNPFSPLLMGLCRVLVYITSYVACGGAEWQNDLLIPLSLVLVYLMSLSYVAKFEKRNSFLKLWITIFLYVPCFYFVLEYNHFIPLPFVMFIVWTTVCMRWLKDPYDQNVGLAVSGLIAGISLLDALILASRFTILGVMMAILAWALTLVLQKFIKGT